MIRRRPPRCSSWRNAAARAVLTGAFVVALTACQVRTELHVTVDDDGSGVVELAVALDDDAVSRRPDLARDLELGDLEASGWVVSGPVEEADGDTWIRARHAFGAPDELSTLLDDVAGADGPFRDFRLVHDDSFARTEYRFTGLVDFTDGLSSVTDDPELADALGAEPAELLEARLGSAIDQLVTVQVAVRLPGDVESNATTQASNGAVWRPSVLEREAVELRATGTLRRPERFVWLGVAAAAGFALVLFVLIRIVAWRRHRPPGPADAGSS